MTYPHDLWLILITEDDSFHSPVGKYNGQDSRELISNELVKKFDVLGGKGSTMKTKRFLEVVWIESRGLLQWQKPV